VNDCSPTTKKARRREVLVLKLRYAGLEVRHFDIRRKEDLSRR